MKSVLEQIDIIKRGTVEIIQEAELKKKLARGKPLIVKAGFDPTVPDIHLGHTVLLRKLRQFQELGHKAIFLIGDYTAMIGDPSGQSQTRKTLGINEIKRNVRTYLKQVKKILKSDNKTFEKRYNSQWFGAGTRDTTMVLGEFLKGIAAKYTVARLMERDDFAKRLKENKPLTVLELLYPLMQGYDSVKLKADIELGGTDQKFNLLIGRDLQRVYNQEPQVVITMPLLEGTDGIKKMSKSLDNYVGIDENPKDIFGKVMSISDELMLRYYEFLTDEPLDKLKSDIEDGTLHPKDAKKNLAKIIIKQYHDEREADKAESNFEKAFKHKKFPDNIKLSEIKIDQNVIDIVESLSRVAQISKGEVRRKIAEGALGIDGKRINDSGFSLNCGREYKVRIGKRFFRVKPQNKRL